GGGRRGTCGPGRRRTSGGSGGGRDGRGRRPWCRRRPPRGGAGPRGGRRRTPRRAPPGRARSPRGGRGEGWRGPRVVGHEPSRVVEAGAPAARPAGRSAIVAARLDVAP